MSFERSSGTPAVDVPGVSRQVYISCCSSFLSEKLEDHNLTEEQTVKAFFSLVYRGQIKKQELNGSLPQKSPSVLDLSANNGKNE